MVEIVTGALLGIIAGFVVGLVIMVNSRDGIWPQVWAGMMLWGGALGAAIGALEWAF